MPILGFSCFVFVDFENVREVDLGLVEGKPVHVALLIGKHQKSLDLGLVRQIHRLANQVELIEVGGSGHNALDLTLAFYLGRAAESRPGAEFHIISKDKDFDPMIAHLQAQSVRVERHDAFGAVPVLGGVRKKAKVAAKPKAAPAQKGPADERQAKVVARLSDSSRKDRPATSAAMLRHIKTGLGKHWTEERERQVVAELQKAGAMATGNR